MAVGSTSRTRDPAVMPAISVMASVAAPSQEPMNGPQRCQASAASCHWARVVTLKATGSKAGYVGVPAVVCVPGVQFSEGDIGNPLAAAEVIPGSVKE